MTLNYIYPRQASGMMLSDVLQFVKLLFSGKPPPGKVQGDNRLFLQKSNVLDDVEICVTTRQHSPLLCSAGTVVTLLQVCLAHNESNLKPTNYSLTLVTAKIASFARLTAISNGTKEGRARL